MLQFLLDKFRSNRKSSPALEKGRRKFGGFFRILWVSGLRLLAPAIVQTGLYGQKRRKTFKIGGVPHGVFFLSRMALRTACQ